MQLLVCIAVIGVITSMLLPAVLQARAAARRIQCQSNLRQIGVALASYEESHGQYPFEVLPTGDRVSGLVSIMERMELSNERRRLSKHPRFPNVLPAVPAYQCPAARFATLSYSLSSGVRMATGEEDNLTFDRPNGMSDKQRAIRASGVTDGLSNTAFYSEALVARPRGSFIDKSDAIVDDPRRYKWGVTGPWNVSTFRNQLAVRNVGSLRLLGRRTDPTTYSHIPMPNQLSTAWEVNSAASEHRNGVNVLFADGSSRLISDGIETRVWHAIGTRNGREVFSTDY